MVWIVFCAVLAVIVIGWALVQRRSLARRLAKLPITPIGKLPARGLVHIYGVVKAPKDALIAAPYTNRLGVYSVSYIAGEQRGAVHHEVRRAPFELADGNDAIRIMADDRAEVRFNPILVELATVGKAKVFGAGVIDRNAQGSNYRAMDYYEALIEVGDYLHVIGVVQDTDGKRVLTSAPGRRLLLAPGSADVD